LKGEVIIKNWGPRHDPEPEHLRKLPDWRDWGRRFAAELDEPPAGPAMPGGNVAEMLDLPDYTGMLGVVTNKDGTWHSDALELAHMVRAWGAVEAQRLVLQEAVLRTPAGLATKFWRGDRSEAAGGVLRAQVRSRMGCELERLGERQ